MGIVAFDQFYATTSGGVPVFADVTVADLRGVCREGALRTLELRPIPPLPGLTYRIRVKDNEFLERGLAAIPGIPGDTVQLTPPDPVLADQGFILTVLDQGGAIVGEASVRLPPSLPDGTMDLEPWRMGGVVRAEPGPPSTMDHLGQVEPSTLSRLEGAIIALLLLVFPVLLIAARHDLLAETRGEHRHHLVLLLLLAVFATAAHAASDHYLGTQLLNANQHLGIIEGLLAGEPVALVYETGYYAIGSIWFAINGIGSPVAMEASGMVMGLCLSLATLAAVYGATAALVRDPDAGLCAAVLLAATPLFLKYAMTIQRDIASTAFAAVAVWAGVVHLRRRTDLSRCLVAVSLALAVYTVAINILLVPVAVAALMAWGASPRRVAPCAVLFLVLCVIPMWLKVGRSFDTFGAPYAQDTAYLVRNTGWLAAFWLGLWHHSILLPVLAMRGFVALWQRDRRSALALAACFGVFFMFLAANRVTITFCDQDRHLLYAYPFMAMAAGTGLRSLVRGRPRDLIVWIVLLYLLLIHWQVALGPLDVRRCI